MTIIDNKTRYAGKTQGFKGLVGDIGGTNARFAVAERGTQGYSLSHFKSFGTEDYPDLYAVIADYFDEIGGKPDLDFAVCAVAGPVVEGRIRFTNLDWVVTEAELQSRTGARKARLLNDYAALAYALPHLTAEDCETVGTVRTGRGHVHAVMGAGTGFGASVLVGGPYGPYCVSTEPGHASWAPVNDFEVEINKFLRKKHGRATIEMLLSGPGLVNLYQAITTVRGEPTLNLSPAEITHLEGEDAQGSRYTVEVFLDILASVAGDLALYQGATSGVFIAGGIVPRLIPHLDAGRFRARFEAKAPMTALVESIPSHIITHKCAALVGAANALTAEEITA